VLLLVIVLSELALRVLLPRPGYEDLSKDWPKGVIVPHASRGFSYTPGYSGRLLTEHGVPYTIHINAQGFRDSDGIDPKAAVRILALGDSITFGWGVEEEQAWPDRLEAMLTKAAKTSVSVYNAGTSGYSVLQDLDAARELFDQVRPQIVVLGLLPRGNYSWIRNPYTYFEGYRVQRYGRTERSARPTRSDRTSSVIVVDGGLLISSFDTPWLRDVDFWFERHFVLGAHALDAVEWAKQMAVRASGKLTPWNGEAEVEATRRRLEPMWSALLELNAFAEAHGAALVVAMIPLQELDGSLFEPNDPGNYVTLSMGFCQTHELDCVSLLQTFQKLGGDASSLVLPHDFHWSRSGHELAARAIADHLLTHQLSARGGS